MDKYKETFETWNKIASLYQDKFMNLSLYDETYDFFCEALKAEQINIFEIGCGPGNITKYLLSKKPNLIIKGIDVAPKMIELAKANNPSANFEVMDTRELGTLNKKFDAIMCGFCLPYLSDIDCFKLIVDSAKILFNNGILYLSFVQGSLSESGFISGSTGDRTYFYYHTLEDINNQLFINNFEVIKLFNINYPKGENVEIHTIIIAKKTA
ncbi:class I SAM-dependent methyltransferase [Flavobacterium sp. ANB]|uniref:class I SAM-dependent DNA methyltransferase n=1 Tax=unclassified Flavobacterium TaxID=196869 RepID=UPI0012B9836C|nr:MULTISPECIES: class I SAM-dependent methyltransferase [unclassified Flavobacterium]MBF4518403.1 class I SAM-dependent methyltransferase [Flavobacterium sp. ANB]MTD70903.1 methyltransferase domain-containing protein [Flavobacterium sp. LC2016-13]